MSEKYPEGWKHCTLHISPDGEEVHGDGDLSIREEFVALKKTKEDSEVAELKRKEAVAYSLEQPIDWFKGAMTVKQWTRLQKDDVEAYEKEHNVIDDGHIHKYEREYNMMYRENCDLEIKHLNQLIALMPEVEDWEGDVRGEVYVFTIPDENEMSLGIVWKQDNNGDTFVISDVILPHLDRMSDNIQVLERE